MNAEQNAAELFILLVPAQRLTLPFCKSFKHAECNESKHTTSMRPHTQIYHKSE